MSYDIHSSREQDIEQVVSTEGDNPRKVVRMQKVRVALNVMMFAASVVSTVCGIVMKTVELASELRSE